MSPRAGSRTGAVFFTLSLLLASTLHSKPAASQLGKANALWWSGDYEAAEAAYLQLAASGTGGIEACLELAAHYRSRARYDLAAEQYRILSRRLESGDPEPRGLEALGRVYGAGSDPGGAALSDLVTVPLGECLYYSGVLDEAKREFRKALESSPRSLAALFGLGRTLFEEGDTAAAEAYFSIAATLYPRFPGSAVYLARIAERDGELVKAADAYARALKVDTHQVELRYFLGEVYQRLERFEDAFREYHRLSGMDPGSSYLLARLEEVRPRLARLEEEIVPVRTLDKFAALKRPPRTERIPLLRVGLNADQRGNPVPLGSVAFLADGAFGVLPAGGETASKGTRADTSRAAPKPLQLAPGVVYRLSPREEGMLLETPVAGAGAEGAGRGIPLAGAVTLEPLSREETSFIVKRVEYARGFAWAGMADRQYRGALEISLHEGGLKIVNIVNLEEYLYSVVPSEMMVSFPEEALEAQAILARSYALATARTNRPHESAGYDLCDGQHCQVYSGASNEYAKTTKAVDGTRGVVLSHCGEVARPLYHSTCGGHTQTAAELNGWGDAPYLAGVVDGPEGTGFPSSPLGLERWIKSAPEVYCNRAGKEPGPEFRWLRIIPAVFLQEKLDRQFDIGELREVSVLRRNSSGYANSLLVTGEKGSVRLVKEGEVRRFLGVGPLRSGLYWLETKRDAVGKPDEFVVYGGGWGHGVGMCQIGAGEMARRGLSHAEILAHYYGKTALKNLGY
jgi:SpoIID/LytB domain protein